MSKTLEEIRKKLQALDSRKGGQNRTRSGDKSVYAHWNIAEGTSSTLRFLPDANPDNTFFWTERQIFKFPFPGIKGQDENKPVIVQAPSIEMWEPVGSCPVLSEVRPWWKDESLKAIASKYWIKRTYYMQGFVVNDALNESDAPENAIRKFIIGPQIYAIIKAALLDPEMGPNSPVNYINGRNFIVAKTSKGGYADYGTSKWSMKESAVTEEMQAAIAQYGLVDLATYLPKKPDAEHLAAIYEMFQASLEGELYDPAKWAQFYKPFGFDSAATDDDGEESNRKIRPMAPSQPKPALVLPTPVVEDNALDDVESTPVAVKESVAVSVNTTSPAPATATAGKSPQEILAMLRSRNK